MIQANTRAVKNQKSGFALLMSLLVVSVIITAGVTILDVSIKQLRLSTNSKDSEIAFHAANAGLECGQYWRNKEFAGMEAGDPVGDVSCFGQAPQPVTANDSAITTANADVYVYRYQFSWGETDSRRCSQIDTVVIVSDTDADSSVPAPDLQSVIPGFPSGPGVTCLAGAVCTLLSSRGYNQNCPTSGLGGTFPAGTIQREVLLEF